MIQVSSCGVRANFAVHLFMFLCCLSIASSARAAGMVNQLAAHPITEGMPRSADFTVKVRPLGHRWQNLAPYLVKVAQGVDIRSPQRAGLSKKEQETPSNLLFLGRDRCGK
jgi:hypothetical protein